MYVYVAYILIENVQLYFTNVNVKNLKIANLKDMIVFVHKNIVKHNSTHVLVGIFISKVYHSSNVKHRNIYVNVDQMIKIVNQQTINVYVYMANMILVNHKHICVVVKKDDKIVNQIIIFVYVNNSEDLKKRHVNQIIINVHTRLM